MMLVIIFEQIFLFYLTERVIAEEKKRRRPERLPICLGKVNSTLEKQVFNYNKI